MADKYYSVIKGEGMVHQVTEGGSTSSEAVELRVNDSIYADKLGVIIGVRAILNHLETKETTPIA
jgi:hypothetical protein